MMFFKKDEREDDFDEDDVHSEEIQEIVTAVPSAILRWGITIFFLIMLSMIALSGFIKYPDIIRTKLRITSLNAPKDVVAKTSGKIVKLLVKDKQLVQNGQTLAYIESTGNAENIIKLIASLRAINAGVVSDKPFFFEINFDTNELGELQQAYQNFYQSYQQYESAINSGIYLKNRQFLINELMALDQQKSLYRQQVIVQNKQASLSNEEYQMHKKLFDGNVESRAEFRLEENKNYGMQSKLIQLQSDVISLDVQYSNQKKAIAELDNQITTTKQSFFQSLNGLLSQAEEWKARYVLSSPQEGKIIYSENLQENQVININQAIFVINTEDTGFFGVMNIDQNRMGKVKEGQTVIIKMKGYPYEEYGIVYGKIETISDIPLNDSTFSSRVKINLSNRGKQNKIILKNGMLADAEIITEDLSLLDRLFQNFIKQTK